MDELTFDESKARLEEIANLVEDPEISLDDALTLYEEAVKLGLHACEVSEQDILFQNPWAEEDAEIAQEASTAVASGSLETVAVDAMSSEDDAV